MWQRFLQCIGGSDRLVRHSWYAWRQRALEILSVAMLVGVVVGPVGILGWLVFFTDTFSIQAITVVDARDHTAAQVSGLMQEARQKNILFLQTEVLEQRILGAVPQVRDAYIVRKLPNVLKVIIQEKTPALLLFSRGAYYFIDEEGLAYEEARLDELPGTVLPVVVNRDAEAEVALGSPVMAPDFVGFVRVGEERLPEIVGFPVVEIRMPSLAAREIHFLLGNNWTIKFDTTRPIQSQLGVLEQLLAQTIPEEERAVLDYIDLRIANRVYYKTRTEVLPTTNND